MDFSVRLEGFDEALKLFDPRAVQKAVASSLNKVAAQAKTEASKAIRESYNIPAAKLGQYLRVSAQAREGSLYAILSGKGKGMPLIQFDARQRGIVIKKEGTGKDATRYVKFRGRATRGGEVSVMVRRESGRKTVSIAPKPFIQKVPTGHVGVFARKGDKRYPIRELYGPGASVMFGNPEIMDRVKKLINAKFTAIFLNDLAYFQGKKR